MAVEQPRILFLIVIGQFCCTTLWFATNAIAPEIAEHVQASDAVAVLTSSVQFGFIIGSLLFAVFSLADRYSASKVFLTCAFLGAASNLAVSFSSIMESMLFFRFMTGFFLAGIYPVGMKIAADFHRQGLGLALGYLVGALVVGTAFPHLLRGFLEAANWRQVIYGASVMSLIGGCVIGVGVGDGPFQKRLGGFNISATVQVFRIPKFRSAAIGYFGHMWELYAFWTFIPVYMSLHTSASSDYPEWYFSIIGIGALGCVMGGYASRLRGSSFVAAGSLGVSLVCCLLSPWALLLPWSLFVLYLLIWGFFVVSDSPQFSSLVAQSAPAELRGTGLTIVNSLGFLITIFSIQLVEWVGIGESTLMLLAVGPLIGLIFFIKN